jgi:hypothetical protein
MTSTSTETTTNGGRRKAKQHRVPTGETKEEAFVRLALQRMNAVKGKIRQVKNLARYPHSDEQAKRIIAELQTLAADVEAAFSPRETNDEFRF